MPDWLQTMLFDPESKHQQLLVHNYQQSTELRSMDNCKPVRFHRDTIELQILLCCSFPILLAYGLSTYLDKFSILFTCDLPAQLYVRHIFDTSVQHTLNMKYLFGPLHNSLDAIEDGI